MLDSIFMMLLTTTHYQPNLVCMPDCFFIHDNRQYLRVLLSDIVYIEALKRYIRIFTTSTSITVTASLNYAEEKLPSERFCRVHKSYIVSLHHVEAFDSENVIVTRKSIPLGKHYKEILQGRLDIWGKVSRQFGPLNHTADGYSQSE